MHESTSSRLPFHPAHARALALAPESVAVAPDGTLWMLDKFGYAFTATVDAQDNYSLNTEPLAYIGPGRPLGFHHDAVGNLVVCDSLKGLMLLERCGGGGSGSTAPADGKAGATADIGTSSGGPQWRLRCLANSAGGRPITYANDLDIAADGTIYFSDSTCIPPALNQAAPRPW